MSPLRSSRYLARSPVRSPGAGLDLVAGAAGVGSAVGALPVMRVSSVVEVIVGEGELCEEVKFTIAPKVLAKIIPYPTRDPTT